MVQESRLIVIVLSIILLVSVFPSTIPRLAYGNFGICSYSIDYLSGTAPLTVTLYNINITTGGEHYNSGTITFSYSINGQWYQHYTAPVEGPIATAPDKSLTFTEPGQYEITMRCEHSSGEVVYSPFINTITVESSEQGGGGGGIQPPYGGTTPSTILVLDPPPPLVEIGERVVFTGYLATADNEPIQGALIEIYGYDEFENEILLTTDITDSNGEFEAVWFAKYIDDFIEVQAYFEGDSVLPEAESQSYMIQVEEQQDFDFSIWSSDTRLTVMAGNSVETTVTVYLEKVTTQPVTLKVGSKQSELLKTVQVRLTKVTGSPPFSSDLTIITAPDTPQGTFTISIVGEGGGMTHSTAVTLVVTAPVEEKFNFVILPRSETKITVYQNQTAIYEFDVRLVSGKPKPIILSIGGPGIFDLVYNNRADWNFDGTKDFEKPPDFDARLYIRTTTQTLLGKYDLTIKALGGNVEKILPITLEVIPLKLEEIEESEFLIKGRVFDISANPLSNSIVVLADYDKMPKIGDKVQKLSSSKPSFKQNTTTSSETAEYKFTFKAKASKDKLPKMVVISLLWYGDDKFAVTDSSEIGGRSVPIYQALCIDAAPTSQCTKWRESDEVKGFEAQVDFIYGVISQFDQYKSFMEIEPWHPGSADIRTLLKDAGVVYFYSYKAMRYLEDVGKKINVSLQPVVIKIRDSNDILCKSSLEGGKGRADNAFYRPLSSKFGYLGIQLAEVQTTSQIVLCDKGSSPSDPDAPDNREWHELSHYFHYQMYAPSDTSNSENHGGYKNPTTNDSLIEGFAEFNSLLIKEYYRDPKPYLYKNSGTPLNIELDYRVWGTSKIKDGLVEIRNPGYEELAVAGILWDLHDNGDDDKFPNTHISKVYSQSKDTLSLPADQILKVIRNKQAKNLLDVRTAFAVELGKEQPVEMIFVNHAAFDDVITRNLVHDGSDEFVGNTGSKSDPTRTFRLSPKPLLPGSYIVTSNDATFNIDIVLDEPYEYYNFSYEVNMTANEPLYFEMPPSYYHSKAVFSQVSDGKTVVPEAIVIDSEEYWQYIDSGPEEDAIFKTIPAKEVTRLDLYEGQWVKYSLSEISTKINTTNNAIPESFTDEFLRQMASSMGLKDGTLADIDWVKTTVKEISGMKYVTVDTIRTKDGKEVQKENTYNFGEDCGVAIPVDIKKGDVLECEGVEATVKSITTKQIAERSMEVFELVSTSKEVDQATGVTQEMNIKSFFDKNTGIILESHMQMLTTGSAGSFNFELGMIAFELDTYELNSKGYDLFKLGKYEEAIPYFDKALKIEPNFIHALNSKGMTLNRLDKYEEAILYLDKSLKIKPDDVYILNEKAYALQQLDKYAEAITYYDKVLAIEPNNAYALEQKQIALDVLAKQTSTVSTTSSSEGGGGCLIATAAFGSELTPQVQFLRSFRDNHILSTAAGSSFMNAFNTWYYSFSPNVADAEREIPVLQQTIKYAIYPLLGILTVGEKTYSMFSGEAGAVMVGLVTSSMIGFVYFSPIGYAIGKLRRFSSNILIYTVMISLAGVIAGILISDSILLMITTSAFVLTVVGVSAVLSSRLISKIVRKLAQDLFHK